MSKIVALDDGTRTQSNHKGVTEQFFVGFIAINVYFFLHFIDDESFKNAIRSHHKKIIKKVVKLAYNEAGQKCGFMTPGLVFYAYEFWEVIVHERFGSVQDIATVQALSMQAIQSLAESLDRQFEAEGLADTIAFLKRY
jgi:hypothetical protein